MNKRNYENIQRIFEEKTGTSLTPVRKRVSGRRLILMAAALAVCLLMTAFSWPLFSPLNGDALSLRGTYTGEGVVQVQVVNGSDKDLRFQEKVKLMDMDTGEEVPGGAAAPVFENTFFPAHSSGTMTIDLSPAYPMDTLETNGGVYYLLLTNQDFLFGQDWMCSFTFRPQPEIPQPEQDPGDQLLSSQNLEGVPESLKFYLERAWFGQVPAWNTAHGDYMQAVQDLLARQEGELVRSVDAWLIMEAPEGLMIDETLPPEEQDRLVSQHVLTLDSFRRMVGTVFPGNGWDCARMLGVYSEEYTWTSDFKFLYFFTYKNEELERPGAYTFLSGRLLTAGDLEPYQIWSSETYTVYDMTDLFYTDLDAYLDDFLAHYEGDNTSDEKIRQRIRRVYEQYHLSGEITFRVPEIPQQ